MKSNVSIALLLSAILLADPAESFGQASPVPPPVEQMRANCSAPTYASDMRVCGTPELLALDETMALLLARAGAEAIEPPSAWIEGQAAWFRRRSLCAMQARQDACLRAAYRERITVLSVIANGLDGNRLTCKARGPLRRQEVLLGQDGSAAIWREGKLVAAAFRQADPRDWKPYVTVEATPRKLVVHLPDGSRAHC
jgi:uncharacterized protein